MGSRTETRCAPVAESKEITLSDREERMAAVIGALDPRELGAYRYFVKQKQPELSIELSEKMYNLFAQGRTCDEIRKMDANKAIGLGSIVHARIRDDWDGQLLTRQQHLVTNTPTVVQQTQLESADFLASLLAASHKLLKEKVDLYLQTGDVAHLKGTLLENLSLKGYQSILDTLMKVTGQDNKKTVTVTGGITVTQTKAPTPVEAADILDLIEVPS